MKLVTLSRKSLSFVRPVLFRPWFYLALGIHAGLLWLPLSNDSEQAEIPPEEEVIKVTQLAASPDTESDTEGNTAIPQAGKGETTTQSSIPKTNPLPPFTPPRSNLYTPFTVTPPEVDEDIAFSPQPTPSPTPTPPQEDKPKPSPSPTNTPENPPPSSNTQDDETTTSGGGTHDSNLLETRGNNGEDSGTSGTTKPDDFFALFPRYPNAEKGSGGVLRNQFETAAYLYNTSDAIESVIAGLDSELQNTPFRWQKTLEDGNFKVYQVTNTETSETKYLHLLSQNEKTVLYLEENDYTLAQLSEAEVKKMEDFQTWTIVNAANAFGDEKLNGWKLKSTDANTLANSGFERFQNSSNHNIFQPEDTVESNFGFAEKIKQALAEPEFRNDPETNLEMIAIGEYQGGLTYKVVNVNKGSYTYLMFVEGNDGQSVMIITPDNPLGNT